MIQNVKKVSLNKKVGFPGMKSTTSVGSKKMQGQIYHFDLVDGPSSEQLLSEMKNDAGHYYFYG